MPKYSFHSLRYAREEGVPANVDATGNYAASPTKFILEPNAAFGTILDITQMIITLKDNVGFQTDGYAGIPPPGLTNGIRVFVEEIATGNVREELTDTPIQQTWQWPAWAYNESPFRIIAGDTFMIYRMDFTKAGTEAFNPGCVRLLEGTRMVVELNDDFTPLTNHRFMFHGVYP